MARKTRFGSLAAKVYVPFFFVLIANRGIHLPLKITDAMTKSISFHGI